MHSVPPRRTPGSLDAQEIVAPGPDQAERSGRLSGVARSISEHSDLQAILLREPNAEP